MASKSVDTETHITRRRNHGTPTADRIGDEIETSIPRAVETGATRKRPRRRHRATRGQAVQHERGVEMIAEIRALGAVPLLTDALAAFAMSQYRIAATVDGFSRFLPGWLVPQMSPAAHATASRMLGVPVHRGGGAVRRNILNDPIVVYGNRLPTIGARLEFGIGLLFLSGLAPNANAAATPKRVRHRNRNRIARHAASASTVTGAKAAARIAKPGTSATVTRTARGRTAGKTTKRTARRK